MSTTKRNTKPKLKHTHSNKQTYNNYKLKLLLLSLLFIDSLTTSDNMLYLIFKYYNSNKHGRHIFGFHDVNLK